jgi:energy-coupling factor transporter ATP-binding protein EcfA2
LKPEYFRIRSYARKFDREKGRFIINISYETAAPQPTERVIGVADAFGLGIDEAKRFIIYDDVELAIGPRDIVYITGDSGSGKSILLKALERDIREDLGLSSINIADIQPTLGRPLVETVGSSLEEALELLSRVGLNDAYLFLRHYEHLSDGQKYRWKLAKMIESKAQFWILDEFASMLDRDTAKIIAFNLQKLARQQGRAVLAATCHTDLYEDLNPSVHIHKRYGKEIKVGYYPNQPARECSLIREMKIEEGSYEDWKQLAGFHYRSHRLGAYRKIFRLTRGEELCGIIVYGVPTPLAYGRRRVLPKMPYQELSRVLSTITRVVIHPKYRTVGLGAKLVRETLPKAGTPYVELVAVMAKYNPFAEKAGMIRVAESKPEPKLLKAAEELAAQGFNIHLLGSRRYTRSKLETQTLEELEGVKKALSAAVDHPKILKKLMRREMIFGYRKEGLEALEMANVDKLAELISTLSILLQTKVYLFWRADELKAEKHE